MVQIIEVHHMLSNKDNFQSRIIESESFDTYKNNLYLNKNQGEFYPSIPRKCKIENLTSGNKWLECEFIRPIDQQRMKHIAWELTLNEDGYIKFENCSEIKIIKSDDVTRGFTREYNCYFVGEESK